MSVPQRRFECEGSPAEGSGAVRFPQFKTLAIVFLLIIPEVYGTRAYGFLPTAMRITVEDPDVTTRSLFTFPSVGVIHPASIFLNLPAIWTRRGHVCGGVAFSRSIESVESRSTSTAVDAPRATPKSGYTFITIIGAGDGLTRLHPASCKALSICFSNSTESESPEIDENVYSVPANGLNAFENSIAFVRSLGDFRRFNSTVASAACFAASAACLKAPARCDSASVACVLADLISPSNESASVRAPRARPKAFDADVLAFPDLVSAWLAWDSAVPETVNAVDALLAACCAITSREPITCAESASFLWPHGYASISERTATAKNQRPMWSNSRSLFLSSELWASTSNNTSNAKNTSAAPSRSLWTRLTESSEFQSGRNIAKCVVRKLHLVGSDAAQADGWGADAANILKAML